jgi:NAD(P)-dependent dehydrogenase (short-subunit alcohol dehydrogenase family)
VVSSDAAMLVDEIHRLRQPRQLSSWLAGGLLGNGMTMTLHTRVMTPFTRDSTTDEVLAGVDLHGRRAIVTGATSAVGAETARALASVGAEVTLAVGSRAAGERTAADITARTGARGIYVAPLELTDRSSVATFAAAWDGPLHILVNAAEILALPELTRTLEGWEPQFATNHLGHFELALGLHKALAAARCARIVSVSSGRHLLSPVIFDDLHFEFRPYDPWLAYAQSKTANVLFALGANARWSIDGITVNAVNPRGIGPWPPRLVGEDRPTPPDLQEPTRHGAATVVLLAASPLLDGVSCRYFEECNETVRVTHRTEDERGVAPYALDPENADRLWDMSTDLLAG